MYSGVDELSFDDKRRLRVRNWLKNNTVEKEKRRIRDREYKKKHREYLREKAREYLINNPDKVKQSKEKRKDKSSTYSKEQRLKYPEKYRARNIVNNSLRSGKIIKEPCSVCGDLNSQAHHDDYNKPLDIIWLCRKHHAEKHYIDIKDEVQNVQQSKSS